MAEELGFEQGLGHPGAVHRNERPAGTTTLGVQGPADQFLPDAVLARDQDLGVEGAATRILSRSFSISGLVPMSSTTAPRSVATAMLFT